MVVRLVTSVVQRPILKIIVRLYSSKLTRIRGLAETLLLVSPRTLASHRSPVVLGCSANTVSQSVVLNRHRVPSDGEREFRRTVPYCCGLHRKRAVIFSSQSSSPHVVLGPGQIADVVPPRTFCYCYYLVVVRVASHFSGY